MSQVVYGNAGFASNPALSGLNLGNAAYGQPASVGYGYGAAGVAGAQLAAPQQAGFQLDEQVQGQIEQIVQEVAVRESHRQPVLRRQVIKVPGPAGRIQQVVRRLPEPQPDQFERVYVIKPQRDVVNVLIERPSTPPPQVQERQVVAKQHRPVVNHSIVRIPARVQQQVVQQPVLQQVVQQPVYDAAPVYGGASYGAAPVYGGASYGAAPVYGGAGYGSGYGAGYGNSFDTASNSVLGGYAKRY